MTDSTTKYEKGQLYLIPCSDLQSDPNQPRKFFDAEELSALASSIKDQGLLQPVIFRQGDNGQLFVVAGERRFQASKISGLDTIPAVFVDGNYSEVALVENVLRQDLTQIELAEGLKRVQDDHGYTQEQLGNIIKKAPSTVSEILSLTKLPEEVKEECRTSQKYTRQALIDIAKKSTHKGMKSAFEKYKKQLEEKKNSHNRYPQRKTWPDKFASLLNDLKKILNKDFEELDAIDKTEFFTNIEELKKIADSYIEKIKPRAEEEEKTEVESRPKRIEIGKLQD